jgi:hypothetical protein
VVALKTAPNARLRDGFDRMQCYGGASRMDMANNGRYSLRLMVEIEGTKSDQAMYGDVFGGRIDQLSTKEGACHSSPKWGGIQVGGGRRTESLGCSEPKTRKEKIRID